MLASAALLVMFAAGPQDLPDSSYQGPHHTGSERFEKIRKCIMWRESRGNYKADGRYGSGAYQFIQRTWDHYVDAAGHSEYVGMRPFKASRYIQDKVFAVALNPLPKKKGLEGLHHWSAVHALTIGKRVKSCR
jgi:hypothetical protein